MTLKEFKSMAQRYGKTYDNTENAKKSVVSFMGHGLVASFMEI